MARRSDKELEAMNIPNKYVSEVIGALPRHEDFSLDHAHEQMLQSFPRYAVTRARLSQAIIKTGKFDTWVDKRTRMFRFRGRKNDNP